MKQWLDHFFREKLNQTKVFRISDGDNIHMVDFEMVKKLIIDAPYAQQREIKLLLIRLDLQQKDITGFLRHLAALYVENKTDEKELIF